jgi:hypothetical protein
LNQSPFIPAKAGIQGPRTRPKTGSPLPRGRTELRGDSNSSHFALAHKPCVSGPSLKRVHARLRRAMARPGTHSNFANLMRSDQSYGS